MEAETLRNMVNRVPVANITPSSYDGIGNQTIEDRLQADTMKEFISYAVGCMFGRYWLDIKGLILANAGDCIEQYIKMVPEPSIAAGTKEKIQAQRDVDRFEKALLEISEWDANVLRPLALKRIERCA